MQHEESVEALRQEVTRNHRTLTGIAGVALIMLVGGAIFYHLVEHFDWLDAFYYCTITLTTVGYGDFVPKTDLGKLFTIFYVIIGIGILATLANTIIKNAMTRRQLKRAINLAAHKAEDAV
ncbi:two pore domain potassium channel family protein [Candidatus Saccharibacteria bacterium]|nr:two pore domain potassium channel family protein [Candidatus Saccharibacteria bacterium]